MRNRKRFFGASFLSVLTALSLAGCGGGGNNNSDSNNAVIIGRVVDITGAPVPGAKITVDNGQAVTYSLSQGGYRLENLSGDLHRVYADTTLNGVHYQGTTQALVPSGATVSNATIQVSPDTQQVNVTGVVTDLNGNPLRDARVFLQTTTSQAGDVASLVAFADGSGNFSLLDVPTAVSGYTVTASLLGYQNQNQNLSPSQTQTLTFRLTGASGQSVLAPSNVQTFSFTQPSVAARASVLPASGSTGSVYETIRRALSPAYAAAAGGHQAAKITRLSSRVRAQNFNGPYAIEMDVVFNPSTSNNLAGYRIYRSDSSSAPLQNDTYVWDFLQDPLADLWVDLDPSYFPNQPYTFAVSAIDNSNHETGISASTANATADPLDLLTLNQPYSGQILSNPVAITWTPINGAVSYNVYVYNQFPSIGSQPVYQKTGLPTGAASYTLPSTGGLASGFDYWVVVAAATSSGAEVSVSQIVRFHVQ